MIHPQACPARRAVPQRASGFTLVEVLVALVILALMALMAWRAIGALITSREIAQTHLDASMKLQTLLQQFDQDIQAVRTGQDSGPIPALSFDGSTLRVVRNQPEGLQLVAWTLRQGRLYRWAGPVTQRQADLRAAAQQSTQLDSHDARLLATADGLSDWQMYFFRGNSWSNAQSSADVQAPAAPASGASEPITTPQQELPTGVRMVLAFAPGSGLEGRLTKTVVIGVRP